MVRNSLFRLMLSVLAAYLFIATRTVQAQPHGSSLGSSRSQAGDSFQVGQTLGDGKDGRIFAKWSQTIKEQEVDSVVVSVRRKSGGTGTYVNLRFGTDGTLENGKRAFLKDNRSQSISWDISGERPSGRPLILTAYDGEVVLDSVVVRYRGGDAGGVTTPPSNPFAPGPKPIPRPGGNYNDDHDDDDDNHGSYQGSDNHNEDPQAVARCRRSYDQRRPQIEVSEIRPSGGLFSGKYKLRGSIRGTCIEEAGYYENGRLKEKISIPLSDRFQRMEFTVAVRSGRDGEVRAFNTRGDEDSVEIDDQIRDGSSSQGNPFNF